MTDGDARSVRHYVLPHAIAKVVCGMTFFWVVLLVVVLMQPVVARRIRRCQQWGTRFSLIALLRDPAPHDSRLVQRPRGLSFVAVCEVPEEGLVI